MKNNELIKKIKKRLIYLDLKTKDNTVFKLTSKQFKSLKKLNRMGLLEEEVYSKMLKNINLILKNEMNLIK